MSQHIIEANSPLLGSVTIMLGIDARLNEVFFVIDSDDYEFRSQPGFDIDGIADFVQQQTKCSVPHAMLQAVRNDLAAVREGATNVNRGIVFYNVDGSVASAETW